MIQAMKNAGFRPAIWIPIICVLLSAGLAWGAWNTLATAQVMPRQEIEEKFDKVQERIEDKIDKIQDILIDKLGD